MSTEQLGSRSWRAARYVSQSGAPPPITILLIATAAAFRSANSGLRPLGWCALLVGGAYWILSAKPKAVNLGIGNGELTLGPRRRIRLAECRMSFGRYSYPSAGTLGTILWLRTGTHSLRIAGMNVLFANEKYGEPDSSRIEYTMQADTFREFVGELAEQELCPCVDGQIEAPGEMLRVELKPKSGFGRLVGIARPKELCLTSSQLSIRNSRSGAAVAVAALSEVKITFGWWQLRNRYGCFQYPIMNIEAPGLPSVELGSSGGWPATDTLPMAKKQSAPRLLLGMPEWRIVALRLGAHVESVFPPIVQHYGKG